MPRGTQVSLNRLEQVIMRKQKEKDIRPSAGAETKPKSRIPPLFRNVFGKPAKESAKRPSDEGLNTHRSASARVLPIHSVNPRPAGQEELVYRSPSTSPILGTSSAMSPDVLASRSSTPIDPQHMVSSSSVKPLPADEATSLHHSSSSPPTVDVNSYIAPANQSDRFTTLGAEFPSSMNPSFISAPDPRASSQQQPAKAPVHYPSDQHHSDLSSSQPHPAVATHETTASKSSTLAKKCIAFVRIVGSAVGISTASMENGIPASGTVGEHCGIMANSVQKLMGSDISPTMRNSLEGLHSKLTQMATEDNRNIEDAQWKITNYLQVFLMETIVSGGISPDVFGKTKEQLLDFLERTAARQAITILPCANAAFNDYTDNTKTQRRESCFKGTRQALLREVIAWLEDPGSNVYVLFGLAGIGKSTIAQTVAETAHEIHLLGASFFFSRDEEERRSAKMLFTTIASQLCVYDTKFAKAIEGVLSTEIGKNAIRKRPLEQLETFILEPLRILTPRSVVVVVDALDECDEEDAAEVIMALNKLVELLPSFKIILTTRPQQHLQFLLDGKTYQKIFHLHNIEDKIVDGDIELYLRHHLAWKQVRIRLPALTKPWAASDEDIQLLLRAADRLFIIASTAVRFILDKNGTPTSRMQMLRNALDQDHIPYNTLNHFYTTILRNAVPTRCERDIVDRYQTVIGSIMLIQQPLTISSLATLTGIEVDDVTMVLSNLQPVILLGSNQIPLIYHKSFPDYIQDPARCEHEDHLIDPRLHHTRMAIRCLRLLNRHLTYNILDLGDPARFMNNDDALQNHGLAEIHVHEQVPAEMQYTCLYFANHFESADVEDTALTAELEQFLNEHLLNWLEALSWIKKLDSAHHTLLKLQKQLKRSSSSLGQMVADGLRFIWKFYDLIRRSALHTYHSALPFAPTETILYKKYSKKMSFCRVLGGQRMWDGLIATLASGSSNPITHIIFSPNSTHFACCKEKVGSSNGSVTIHNAVSGIPLGRIDGEVLTISSNFSKAVAFNDALITLYIIKGVTLTPVATIKPSTTVAKLTLSPDGSRLLAGLDDGTVGLWDTEKCEQIKSIDRWEEETEITFSMDGTRAVFASSDGVVKLLDGMEGNIIADLAWPGIKEPILNFSGNGSRLACLDLTSLKVWNSQDGALIATAKDFGHTMAISTDGSLLATGKWQQFKLWNGNNLVLLKTLDLDFQIRSLAIHNDLIGMASWVDDLIALYDINSHTFVAQLPFGEATALAFSPDCMRLAAGSHYGNVQLCDVPSLTTSNGLLHQQLSEPTALAFSLNGLRLASGHNDGTVKMWDPSNLAQLVARKCHLTHVTALAFSINSGELVSGSEDGVIQLWNGEDGEPSTILECSDQLTALALSSTMLAAATKANITLWDLNSCTGSPAVAMFDLSDTGLLAFSHNLSLLAATHERVLMLWDIAKHTISATSTLACDSDSRVWSMKFLPDDSQLAIQLYDTHFYLYNTHNGEGFEVSENQNIDRLGLCPSWHGIPVWALQDSVVSRFPQVEENLAVLSFPSDLRVVKIAEGSSTIALGCEDGHIILIRAV